jgi:hypothetical protein
MIRNGLRLFLDLFTPNRTGVVFMKFQVIAMPLIGAELPNGKALMFGMTRDECASVTGTTPSISQHGHESLFTCDHYTDDLPLILEYTPSGILSGIIADKWSCSVAIYSRSVLDAAYETTLDWLCNIDGAAIPQKYEGITSNKLGISLWTPGEDDDEEEEDYVPDTVKLFSPALNDE